MYYTGQKSHAHNIIYSGRSRRMLVTVADSAVYNNIPRIFLGTLVLSKCFTSGSFYYYGSSIVLPLIYLKCDRYGRRQFQIINGYI